MSSEGEREEGERGRAPCPSRRPLHLSPLTLPSPFSPSSLPLSPSSLSPSALSFSLPLVSPSCFSLSSLHLFSLPVPSPFSPSLRLRDRPRRRGTAVGKESSQYSCVMSACSQDCQSACRQDCHEFSSQAEAAGSRAARRHHRAGSDRACHFSAEAREAGSELVLPKEHAQRNRPAPLRTCARIIDLGDRLCWSPAGSRPTSCCSVLSLDVLDHGQRASRCQGSHMQGGGAQHFPNSFEICSPLPPPAVSLCRFFD